jgi:tryptophan synthase alpha chain
MLGIYLTAGHPDLETSKKALRSLDDQGVELIEIGVPFSDPLADGPVIQKSSFEALQNGVNLDVIFKLISELRNEGTGSKEKIGLNNVILFSYFNPLFSYGFDNLIKKCKETGIRGALIPDLPIEEAQELSVKFKEAGLDLILLVAVTSTPERIKKIAELSHPWIYLVSRTGVTGSKEDIQNLQTHESSDEKLKSLIKEIKSHTNKQVAVGFGIDSKEKVVHTLSLGADMAIIGSKTVKLLAESGLGSFSKFIAELN